MTTRVRRRGDNIPSVKDYAHWNEDAERVWYEENRYDMEHADEIMEEDFYDERDYEPDPFEDWFKTEAEARAFALKVDASDKDIDEWAGAWCVSHFDKKLHRKSRETLP